MTDHPTRDVVFLDCETNGLDPDRHVAWDIAAWNLTTGHRAQFFAHIPDVSRFLATAEVKALRVNRFLDRYPWDACPSHEDTEAGLGSLRDVLDGGRTLTGPQFRDHPRPVVVGSKPTFDQEFVARLARDYGYSDPNGADLPWWHYHPVDLGAYAAGVAGIEPGTSSLSAREVAALCGVDTPDHSAAGDVTSGGRAFLLLREAARRGAQGGSARIYLDGHGLRGDAIEAELLRPEPRPEPEPVRWQTAGATAL